MKKKVLAILSITICISMLSACGNNSGLGERSIEETKNAKDTASVEEVKNVKIGDVIKFGTYEQDNDLTNGPEPIEWQVLGTRDGYTFLLSKYALDGMPYNEKFTDITWENCTLRSWLNNDFYNIAFSDLDKKKNVTAHNENPDSYELYKPLDLSYGAEGGSVTDDKVFLLSWTEARDYLDLKPDDPDLGAENYNPKMLCRPTAFAKARGAVSYLTIDNYYPEDTDGCCWWWLRSPGLTQKHAANVRHYGALDDCDVNIGNKGVRPALLIGDKLNDSLTEPEYSTKPETPKESEDGLEIVDTVILGTYEQDNDLTNGSEPIEWQVIGTRDGHTLLLSKYALDCKRYNETDTDITWEDCTLRSWLNNDFYNTAFSASDKERIVTAHNENPDSYEFFKPYNNSNSAYIYGAKGGNATNDKVFLLSWTETRDYLDGKIWDGHLGSENNNQKLLCMPTAYAKAQGVHTSYIDNQYPPDAVGYCYWWLRSPSSESQADAVGVLPSGALYDLITVVIKDGVRPAILID